MAFYLKYRPQTIKDLDLASVRDSLTKALQGDSVPHSFLFAGPKGTGKTSAARILAKAVNCENRASGSVEPCGTCEQCTAIARGSSIDVIELDAASHRGIDDIRTLRDAVKLAPAHAKRKVYIIDEAHMLTTEASNALLKTLEEPPEHVLFVLATTNPEKLIPTIRSRTTLIQFVKASADEIVSSLQKKLKGEGIEAEDDALHLIASAADGSFRDADKLLEQFVTKGKKLTKADVSTMLNPSGEFDVSEFIKLLLDKEVKKALTMVNSSLAKGSSSEALLDTCLKYLRESLLASVGIDASTKDTIDKDDAIKLIHLLVRAKGELKNSPVEQLPFELAIVEWSLDSETKNTPDTGKNGNGASNGHSPILEEVTTKEEIHETKKAIGNGESVSQDLWAKVLSEVRPINASTEALLRASRPLEMSGNKLKLGVYYRFHKEHLESVNHRTVLEKVCSDVFGNDTLVECLLTDPPQTSTPVQNDSAQSTVPTQVDAVPEQRNEKPGAAVLSQKEDEEIMQMAKDIFGE